MSIRQRQFPVLAFSYNTTRFPKLGNIEAPDCQIWERINEGQKLHSALLIIAAKEPTMAFGDYQ